MNEDQAVASAWCAAVLGLCLLLLPDDWKGLAAIPAFGWVACWSLLRTRRRELDELDELDEDQAAAELDDWPAMLRAAENDPELPDEEADPIGRYAMLAARYTNAGTWQQQQAGHQAHLLPETGGPAQIMGNAGPPPATRPELDHTAELDPVSAEIDTWPAAEDLAADMAADAALERVRASFDLARRMIL